jgi:hypothetical protein
MKFSLVPFLKRNAPTILTVFGVAGTVATGVLSAKNTPKALQSRHDSEEEKGAPLTRMETFIAMAPAYIPAAGVCVLTILCIISSDKLNKERQATIMGAYTVLKNTFDKYRAKANELYGEGTDKNVYRGLMQDRDGVEDKDAWTNEKLNYYMAGYPKIFERTREEVFDAIYTINHDYIDSGYASLSQFYTLLDLPATEEDEDQGWSMSDGLMWLDFIQTPFTADDGTECIEIFPYYPPWYGFLDD